jgi:hypothetical protein
MMSIDLILMERKGVPESCKLKLIVQEGTVQNSLKKYCQNPFKVFGFIVAEVHAFHKLQINKAYMKMLEECRSLCGLGSE